MNSSEIEQLTDEIVGEAVLYLLKENLPVNVQGLIRQLRVMKDEESDVLRRDLIVQVISKVSSTVVSTRRKPIHEESESVRDARKSRDNVYQLFDDSKQSGTGKKH
ncbi:hypothetical protein [Atlantibacter hermannii]|uniref:hypothetical protein n=1 Tax=Atlantibacter hermannii TaxID=565 RepID=UPI0028A26583|nr:hypothetical protein [Atlantibacter hermannii]